MNDRELLEAAATAVGMSEMLTWTPGATAWLRVNPTLSRPWNPLTDDGDALRLAVKLGIRIEPSPRGCSVLWRIPFGLRVETILNSTIGADSETSTRRAIVVAAAKSAVPAVGAA